MRSRLPLAVLLLVLAGAAPGASPACVFACSCAQPPTLKIAVEEWGSALFTGLAAGRTGNTVSFAVERWFAGSGAAPIVQLQTGDSAMCGIEIQPGDRLVLTASRGDNGVFVPSICSPYARLGSAEANALLAEAEETFGPGQVLTGPGPTEPGDGGSGGGWLPAVGIGVGVALVGGLAVAAFVVLRRRPA
jgi:hypothetical protein